MKTLHLYINLALYGLNKNYSMKMIYEPKLETYILYVSKSQGFICNLYMHIGIHSIKINERKSFSLLI